MNLKRLTHKELVEVWTTTQGDLSVPPHLRKGGNRELTIRCFLELLRRSPDCKGRVHPVLTGNEMHSRRIKRGEGHSSYPGEKG